MPGTRWRRRPALAWAVAALVGAAVVLGGPAPALALATTPAAEQPADPDEPVDIAELLAGLDLFPEGQLDEQRLAGFSSALSRAADGPPGVAESARSLAAAAQQFQHIQQSGDPALRDASLTALAAALDEARNQSVHPALQENLDTLAAQVQQYRSLTASASDAGSVREAPAEAIANRRGPALALIGLALAALALGVIRLSAARRDRSRAE